MNDPRRIAQQVLIVNTVISAAGLFACLEQILSSPALFGPPGTAPNWSSFTVILTLPVLPAALLTGSWILYVQERLSAAISLSVFAALLSIGLAIWNVQPG
jgi:hypothetical protein